MQFNLVNEKKIVYSTTDHKVYTSNYTTIVVEYRLYADNYIGKSQEAIINLLL